VWSEKLQFFCSLGLKLVLSVAMLLKWTPELDAQLPSRLACTGAHALDVSLRPAILLTILRSTSG